MNEFTIRAFEPSDIDDVTVIFQAPLCQRNTMRMPYESFHGTRERMSRSRTGRTTLVAEDHETQRVVGIASLDQESGRRSHVGQIGMCVHDDFQGRGMGGALLGALIDLADRWLRIERLELCVYVDNAPAIRLYERSGFETEGTHRAFVIRDGETVDAYCMARLKG